MCGGACSLCSSSGRGAFGRARLAAPEARQRRQVAAVEAAEIVSTTQASR
jgi:hypothetical protein